MTAPRDLSGQTFGRLTVLHRAGSHNRRAQWRCRCACGKEVSLPGTYLTSGDTQSCGCLHREMTAAKGRAKAIDLTSKVFGRLTVLRQSGQVRKGKGELLWECRCTCGKAHIAIGTRLRKHRCLSCGCLRNELQRARAAAVGSARRIKACRTCGDIYEAVGPQKDCSTECRLRHHAEVEAQRREERAQVEVMRDLTALTAQLEERVREESN